MELKDICTICQANMARTNIKRIIPCQHLFHEKCLENWNAESPSLLYRGPSYDRKRIVEAASRGSDWTELTVSLGIQYKTAYTWVMQNKEVPLKRGGKKLHILTNTEVDEIMSWVKLRPDITLKQIKDKSLMSFEKIVTISTIGNSLHGRTYSTKIFHTQTKTINSTQNKIKRSEHAGLGLVAERCRYYQHPEDLTFTS